MKSRAHFKNHPIHPILIVFPIAFIYGCLIADLIGRFFDLRTVLAAGAYMSVAAVITGLIAGVPGFVDYVSVVPPNSSAKKRATQHMVVNVAALSLIAIGWPFRDWDTMHPSWAAIALELVGVGLVTWGGWLGGTLVHRNQIGVDHRYAHAGKWREQTVEGDAGATVAVDGTDDMKPGQMRLLRWKQRRLVLARTDEGFAVFDDRCTHKGGSLADGALMCNRVQCPWHGSHFDVNDGSVKAGPADQSIVTFRTEVRDGRVHVTLPIAE